MNFIVFKFFFTHEYILNFLNVLNYTYCFCMYARIHVHAFVCVNEIYLLIGIINKKM